MLEAFSKIDRGELWVAVTDRSECRWRRPLRKIQHTTFGYVAAHDFMDLTSRRAADSIRGRNRSHPPRAAGRHHRMPLSQWPEAPTPSPRGRPCRKDHRESAERHIPRVVQPRQGISVLKATEDNVVKLIFASPRPPQVLVSAIADERETDVTYSRSLKFRICIE